MSGLPLRALAVAAFGLGAVPAAAQNPSALPDHGEVELNAGFSPDPWIVPVRAGGGISATRLGGNCVGEIGNEPDVTLDYRPGSLPLIFSVEAGSDTTLAIRTPGGAWVCDDDGGERGNNPSIRFQSPERGRYAIFVGTYSNSGPQPARLHISEVRSQ